LDKQERLEHRGFTISTHLTAKNCSQCHATEYNQFILVTRSSIEPHYD
jgi:hypothetical protein